MAAAENNLKPSKSQMAGKEARTVKEALIAEMLGDIDTILARVNALPVLIESAEERLTGTIAALDAAGDKYRTAVALFNEQAKADLSAYLDRKAVEILSNTTEEQKAAIQEAARLAFRSEAADKAADLAIVLSNAAKGFRRSVWVRMFEHAATAIISSMLTVYLVLELMKHH